MKKRTTFPTLALALLPIMECLGCSATMSATPAASPSSASRSTVAAFAGGLAVVGAGVGIGFGVAALNDKSDFDKNPSIGKGNAGNQNALYSDTAFGAAAILGVTSAVLFLTNDHTHDPAPLASTPPLPAERSSAVTVSATPILLSHGGGAGALVRF